MSGDKTGVERERILRTGQEITLRVHKLALEVKVGDRRRVQVDAIGRIFIRLYGHIAEERGPSWNREERNQTVVPKICPMLSGGIRRRHLVEAGDRGRVTNSFQLEMQTDEVVRRERVYRPIPAIARPALSTCPCTHIHAGQGNRVVIGSGRDESGDSAEASLSRGWRLWRRALRDFFRQKARHQPTRSFLRSELSRSGYLLICCCDELSELDNMPLLSTVTLTASLKNASFNR